jgi:mono/diheme cytochrome c family protein
MKPVLKAFALLVLLLAVGGAILVWYIMTTGVSAREQPGYLEEFAARRVRTMAIARRARSLANPVEYSGEIIAAGRAHFADHCAVCHANDGSGDTAMGRGMWPKAPDMRLPATQDLSDGELFWIIDNGIRFTGMPGWGTGTKDGEEASWHLVHFIRRLPKLTPPELEEMKALNPKSPEEWQQMQEEQEFLEGGGEPAEAPAPTPHKHPGGSNE